MDSVGASATCDELRMGCVGLVASLAFRVGFRNSVESRMQLLLVRAGASTAMVAAACLYSMEYLIRKAHNLLGSAVEGEKSLPV